MRLRFLLIAAAAALLVASVAGCVEKGDTTVNAGEGGGDGGSDQKGDCTELTCFGMCAKLRAETFKYCEKLAKDAPIEECETECRDHGGDRDTTGLACVCNPEFRACYNEDGTSAFRACGDLL